MGFKSDFIFHYGAFHSVFHYAYFPAMFYTMGQLAMFYTMGGGSAVAIRARSCPFGGRHGMASPQSSKANKAIFKPVARRYIFFSGVTWVKI
jgi:hypothetical protein